MSIKHLIKIQEITEFKTCLELLKNIHPLKQFVKTK